MPSFHRSIVDKIKKIYYNNNIRIKGKVVKMINPKTIDLDKVNTEFLINENKRTVTCIISTINDIPLRLQKYGFSDNNYDDIDFEIRKYVGIAKCSPDDTWNERYGKQLAEYRALQKRKTEVNNEILAYIKRVGRDLNKLEKYGLIKPSRPPQND